MASSSKGKPDGRGGRSVGGQTRSQPKDEQPADEQPRSEQPGDETLRAVLDSAVDAILIIDDQGVVETYNNAAQQIFQYRAEEVVGHNVSMLMPEPFSGEHNRYIQNYLRTGQEKVIGIGREAVGRRKDGSIIPIELAVSEVKVDGRRRFTGIVRDITERKRLEKEILDVAEREQQRLGFDLHDGLCQEIAGIAFLVQSAQQKAAGGAVVQPTELAAITDLLQKALRHARGLSRGLYPVGPQPNGLSVALADLAANTADVFKVNCTFDSPVPVTTRDSVAATHLFRIAQEAVRDAVRHGKASNVAIELVKTRDVLRVSINDDGLGINEDGRFREDRTLHMMRYRARIIGAVLRLEPREGGGASVTCELRDSRK